jgi:hypothetical protein
VLVSRPVLIIIRFTWAKSAEHLLDLGPRLSRTRRESRNDRQETVAGQCLQLEVGGRPNHGRTRHPAEQRNLPESIAWAKRCDQMTVSNNLRRTRLDHIEAVGRITLAKYGLAGGHLDRFQTASQLFDGRQGSG